MDFEERLKLEDASSLLEWYPKVVGHFNIPRTEIYVLTDKEMKLIYSAMADSENGAVSSNRDDFLKMGEKIKLIAAKIGYPLFLRSDQGSGKHEWNDTYYVTKEEDLMGHIMNLHMWHAMAGIFGIRYRALVFRELLTLNSSFTAFNDMPIARERRYFVRDGNVECHHPYWVAEAIHAYRRHLPDNWKHLLEKINTETTKEVSVLSEDAKRFATLVPGYWSVDFAEGTDGTWWLIDAARGEVSWHPEECPYNLQPKDINPAPNHDAMIDLELIEQDE